MKSELVDSELVTWQNIEVGQVYTGLTDKVVEEAKSQPYALIKINQFLSGILPLEHTADRSVLHIPEKLKQPGKKIKVRVFSVNKLTKTLIFTKKKMLMKQNTPVILKREDIQIGQEAYGVVGRSIEGGYIIKFMNDIAGFLPSEEIPEENTIKSGQTIRVFVGYNNLKQKKIGLALSPEGAQKIGSKQSTQTDDLKEVFANVKSDLNEGLSEETRSSLVVGQIFKFRQLNADLDPMISHDPEKYLVLKTVDLPNNFYVHVPKFHLSDFKQHNDKLFEFLGSTNKQGEMEIK